MPCAFETARWWRNLQRTDWSGHDPYDGLMVTRFPATLLLHHRLTRLALIQAFKRSPVNLRGLFGVPKLRNPKAMALGLESACRLARIPERRAESTAEAHRLTVDLLGLAVRVRQGAGWGYPFDWQARAFYIPRNTPTVVCTGFVVRALDHARQLFEKDSALVGRIVEAMRSASAFVEGDLNRTEDEHGFCWSYSPLDRSAVVNATLLGAETVARTADATADATFRARVEATVRWALSRQSEEGGWAYGEAGHHRWEDAFHTGFNIASLRAIHEVAEALHAAPEAWIPRARIDQAYRHFARVFFDPDGRPWYYRHKPWPIDAHAAAVAVLTHLAYAGEDSEAAARAERTLRWSLKHLWLEDKGHFAYQIHPWGRITIDYLRWCQAWMLRALAEWEVHRAHSG